MFPTCPSCKQSVLEDNAETCPFCGANMKTGKGGKAAAPPASVKVAPAAAGKASAVAPAKIAAPAAKSMTGKPAAAKSAASDDDDPFGIHEANASRATPLSLRPAKGKTTKFTCPMCETIGFGSPEFAGKEVKCCNDKCPLPIFTAPKVDGVATANQHPMGVPQTVTAKGTSLPMILMAVMALAMAGGSVWYFVIRDPNAGLKPALPPPPPINGNTPIAADPDKNKKDQPVEKTPAEIATELRALVLPKMVKLSLQEEKNRSKPFCRRLVAEAFVEAGDIPAAQKNIEQLLKVAQKFPYHQVPPLVQMAWRERQLGNVEAAQAALDRAFKARTDLSDESRLTFDTRTDLAALLFVTGRSDEAVSLMDGKPLPLGSSGLLSAVSRRASLLNSFDVTEAVVSLPVISWKSPQWVVTTITLVLRGHPDHGLNWAKLAPDLESQAECFAAWGDAIVVSPKPSVGADEAIQSSIRLETPAVRARVWARVATARLAAKQKDAAGKAVAQAAVALKEIALPTDFVLPELKELTRLQITDSPSPRVNAISAAEVARAQALIGQTRQAGESLNAAMQHVRGHAPSLFVAQRRYEEISREAERVRADLKKALDLKTNDQIQQALTGYRGKMRSLLDGATARQSLQVDILKSACDWPLLEAAWAVAVDRDDDATPEESREQFLKTNLAVRLAHRLRAAGKTDLAGRCDKSVITGSLIDARDVIERETAEALNKSELMSVADRLANYQPAKADKDQTVVEDADWPQLWLLRLATQLSRSGQSDKALELIASVPDMQKLWREEGYQLLAALIAKSPAAAESLWKKYNSSLLSATEQVAMFRGLCNGLSTVIDVPQSQDGKNLPGKKD